MVLVTEACSATPTNDLSAPPMGVRTLLETVVAAVVQREIEASAEILPPPAQRWESPWWPGKITLGEEMAVFLVKWSLFADPGECDETKPEWLTSNVVCSCGCFARVPTILLTTDSSLLMSMIALELPETESLPAFSTTAAEAEGDVESLAVGLA